MMLALAHAGAHVSSTPTIEYILPVGAFVLAFIVPWIYVAQYGLFGRIHIVWSSLLMLAIGGGCLLISFYTMPSTTSDTISETVESHYHVTVTESTSHGNGGNTSVLFTDSHGHHRQGVILVEDAQTSGKYARLMVNKDSHLVEYSP